MYLGTLYDLRVDSISTGDSPWSVKQLQKRRRIKNATTHQEFSISTTTDEITCSDMRKAALLGLSDNEVLSLCAGFIAVDGSAKYWNDKRLSVCQVIYIVSILCNIRSLRARVLVLELLESPDDLALLFF